MNDITLRNDVPEEIEFERSVDAGHIGVAVSHGIVTLTGQVGSYADKAGRGRRPAVTSWMTGSRSE